MTTRFNIGEFGRRRPPGIRGRRTGGVVRVRVFCSSEPVGQRRLLSGRKCGKGVGLEAYKLIRELRVRFVGERRFDLELKELCLV